MNIDYNPHRVAELLAQRIADLVQENAMLASALEVISQQAPQLEPISQEK